MQGAAECHCDDGGGDKSPRPLASGCLESVAQQQALQIFQTKPPMRKLFSLFWCHHGSLDPAKHCMSTTDIIVGLFFKFRIWLFCKLRFGLYFVN